MPCRTHTQNEKSEDKFLNTVAMVMGLKHVKGEFGSVDG